MKLAEKYHCPKNRLNEGQTKGKIMQEQGVRLELKSCKVESMNFHMVDESEVEEIPELVSNLDEADREWMEMVARFTAIKVTFL